MPFAHRRYFKPTQAEITRIMTEERQWMRSLAIQGKWKILYTLQKTWFSREWDTGIDQFALKAVLDKLIFNHEQGKPVE